MKNISFVILNYKTWQESVACVESIQGLNRKEHVDIILVDNGSANESVDKLREIFKSVDNVTILSAGKNLGFAKGNNLGITYAKEHFDPDFIVAANSDILFEQPDFCEKIEEIYEKIPFGVLGGDILDATRTQHLNPVAEKRNYTIPYMRKQMLVSYVKALSFRLIKALHLKKKVMERYGVSTDETGKDVNDGSKNLTTREVDGRSIAAADCVGSDKEDVLLHGCCMIFSKDYLEQLGGFWPDTFLYAEEEIVYYLAKKKGLKVLYSPQIGCIHKEAVTTSELYRDFCDRKIFYFSNVAESYRKFLGLMKRMEKDV